MHIPHKRFDPWRYLMNAPEAHFNTSITFVTHIHRLNIQNVPFAKFLQIRYIVDIYSDILPDAYLHP